MPFRCYFVFIFLICLASGSLQARHIIGGDLSYVCNGDGTYTFLMKIYRDCSSGGAQYDDPAVVSIYEGTTNSNSLLISNVPGTGIRSTSNIPPDANPCLIVPPNVCVEEATYQFKVSLPVISDSYFVVYQRCCRNNTITNIRDPRSSGATYSIELTPRAQELCNNSPTFNNFPPIVICNEEPLDFDHSASDAEGDQLVYSFCAPLLGGGLGGSPEQPGGTATACDGVAPNPACKPPFRPVIYNIPTYSASNPMGGSPQVDIDPVTGLITGTPNTLGQFVVGVCVEEYRNGELLSVIRRDFQFNVASCTPLVDARIQYDEQISDKLFVVNACGESSVTFINQSVQERNITERYWIFDDINGQPLIIDDWNATVNFPDTGRYTGRLILNPGLDCGDTANLIVNVFPEAIADFTFSYDTCVAGPVTFSNASFSDGGAIVSHFWDFADGNTSGQVNPVHQYTAPGSYNVSLTVVDVNGCEDTYVQTVEWFPAPPLIVVQPSIFDGCSPQYVFFNNLSTPIDDTYDIVWDLGDGNTSNEISPSHIYEEVGSYDVSLQITSPIGCMISRSWDNWITVRPAPIADYIFSPDNPSNFMPEVSFFDQSTDAVQWQWIFDDNGTSTEENPVFVFPDTGLQEVTLIVTHPSGCKDTLVQFIDIEPQIRYFIPNAFSPNSDNRNDFFKGTGIFDGMNNFRMTIWNRWGEMVFQTLDPDIGWNGRKNNTGNDSPLGVYLVLVEYTGPRGDEQVIKGYATLVR